MNRKTAIAAAIAITMSLTSGVVAMGANAGVLGFGGTTSVAATPSAVVSTVNQASRGHEQDDSARAITGADRATSTKGEHYD